MATTRLNVLVCSGAACLSAHSKEVKDELIININKHNLNDEVKIIETGCMGPCEMGPIILVYPEGTFYKKVKKEDVAQIVEEHFLKGRVVKRLLFETFDSKKVIESHKEVTFFQKQQKIVLKNCGVINPESLEEYIATDGYLALGKVLTEMKPEEVTDDFRFWLKRKRWWWFSYRLEMEVSSC